MTTHLNVAQLAKAIEKLIIEVLVWQSFEDEEYAEREQPIRAEYQVVKVFRIVEQQFEDSIVTAGFFNGIVTDMKRAGLIGTARGGEVMFLSEHSFQEEVSKRDREKKASAKAGV